MHVVHVVGARPNFMKIAPLMRALSHAGDVTQSLIHTGQHYDASLSDHFFADLEIPTPDLNLGVGSGGHGLQTGRVMIALEPAVERLRPDWLVTAGSANSTLAAALVAVKLRVPVAHVEAGLRSGQRAAPEEINRILVDALAEALFTTEPTANENLRSEGIPPERIHYVGNVMIDTLDRYRSRATSLRVHESLGLEAGRYVLVTLHRPRNVDDPARLGEVLDALARIGEASGRPVVLPLHPRTGQNIRRFGLDRALSPLLALAPLRYLEFLCLMDHAGAVVTDSGGVTEETTVLGVPCVTLGGSTERPITVERGTNRLFDGPIPELPEVVRAALEEERRPYRPPLWDGRAAERIAETALRSRRGRSPAGPEVLAASG